MDQLSINDGGTCIIMESFHYDKPTTVYLCSPNHRLTHFVQLVWFQNELFSEGLLPSLVPVSLLWEVSGIPLLSRPSLPSTIHVQI